MDAHKIHQLPLYFKTQLPDLSVPPLLPEWENLYSYAQKSSGNLSQKSGGYYKSKSNLNLLWDVQQADIGVMGRFPQTFDYSVHLLYICIKNMWNK